MERRNGFLLLKNYKLLDKEVNQGCSYFYNTSFLQWMEIENEEYLFKSGITPYVNFSELLGEQIALSVDIPTVHYDLAKYKGKFGVISNNYNPDHKKEVLLSYILEKYFSQVICSGQIDYDGIIFSNQLHNLENIWAALEYYYNDNKNKQHIVSSLMFQIIDSFILQILQGNADLHSGNIVILDGELPCLAANFDYGQIGLIDLTSSLDVNNYKMDVTTFSFYKQYSPQKTIKNFLEISDPLFQYYFFRKVEMLPDIEYLIEKIEIQIQNKLDENIRDYLIGNYQNNKNYLLSLRKNKSHDIINM